MSSNEKVKMKIINKLWEYLNSKFFFTIATIFSIVFGIYGTFFYERSKDLTITQSFLGKVFDVHQPVGGLEISYAGENLRGSKKTLWAANITIANTGKTGIKIDDFDTRYPIGIEVKAGQIVDTPKYLANNTYLHKFINLNVTKQKILISPIIIEPIQQINLSFIILGSENQKPEINTVGVIAGIGEVKKLVVIEPLEDKSKESFVTKVLTFVAYAFTLLLICSLIYAIIIEPIIEFFRRKERFNLIKKYKINEAINKETRFLIELFHTEGKNSLVRLVRQIQDIENQNLIIASLNHINDEVKKSKIKKMINRIKARKLISSGIAVNQEDKIILSTELSSSLSDLFDYLKIDQNEIEKEIAVQRDHEESFARYGQLPKA